MMTYEKADREARIFVNGLRKAQVTEDNVMHGNWVVASGEWSQTFRHLPIVKQANEQGWAKDLRQHLIRTVRRQMLRGEPYDDIDRLMPDKDSIWFWRDKAQRENSAAEWREQIIEQYGDLDTFLGGGKPQRGARSIADASRQAFNKMRRMSPNRHLHIDQQARIAPDRKTQAAGGE